MRQDRENMAWDHSARESNIDPIVLSQEFRDRIAQALDNWHEAYAGNLFPAIYDTGFAMADILSLILDQSNSETTGENRT